MYDLVSWRSLNSFNVDFFRSWPTIASGCQRRRVQTAERERQLAQLIKPPPKLTDVVPGIGSAVHDHVAAALCDSAQAFSTPVHKGKLLAKWRARG